MNECEGAFRLHRSVLSPAEREVRLVSLQKDGLNPLLCPENPKASPRGCSELWGSSCSRDFTVGSSKWSRELWASEFPPGRREERELQAILQLQVGFWNSGNFFFSYFKVL